MITRECGATANYEKMKIGCDHKECGATANYEKMKIGCDHKECGATANYEKMNHKELDVIIGKNVVLLQTMRR